MNNTLQYITNVEAFYIRA